MPGSRAVGRDSTAVIQPPGRPCATRQLRARPPERDLDRLEARGAPSPSARGARPAARRRVHRPSGRASVAPRGLPASVRDARRRARSTSAGLPSHQVATSSGRVRATRDPDRYEPAASDRPSAPPASPVSASASASTCGRPITRATAASCSSAVVGTGLAPRSHTSPASPQPGLEVGVGLEGQRPRRVAEQQRVGRGPAALLGAGERVAADEAGVGHLGAHDASAPALQRADVGEHGAGFAGAARASAPPPRPRAAASPARPGRRHAPRPASVGATAKPARAGRGGGGGVDVVPDDLDAGVAGPRAATSRRSGPDRAPRRGGTPAVTAATYARLTAADQHDRAVCRCQDFLQLDRYVQDRSRERCTVRRGGGSMAQRGFAVAAFRDGRQWRVEPLPPAMLTDLGVLLSALRSQPPEGGPFVIASVDDEFFLIARQDGPRISLLLSDLTAAVEYPLAEQALTRLGEDPPDDDELDEVWPVGDLDLFADLGLAEDEMERHPRRHRRLPRRDARRDRRPHRASPTRTREATDAARATVSCVLRRRAGPRRGPLARPRSSSTTASRWPTSPTSLRDTPGDVRLLVIEQDDEYAALVRVDDDDDDPRAFLSDGHAADGYAMAAVVAEELDEIGGEDVDDELLEDAPPAHDSAPFGDPNRRGPGHAGGGPAGDVRARGHAADRPDPRGVREGRLRGGLRGSAGVIAGVDGREAALAWPSTKRGRAPPGEIPVGAVVLDAAGGWLPRRTTNGRRRTTRPRTPRCWRCAGPGPRWAPGS